MLVKHLKIDEVINQKLIDVEHRKRQESCSDDSEEVVLHFSGGKEISIYVANNTVYVEGD